MHTATGGKPVTVEESMFMVLQYVDLLRTKL